ncbi:MAG: hypothetical protein DMG58_09680 [Acidobacteria bacterium]|nr:MAG: hypothetical protein DMG58_09680 [Acidobacteriota bacterium]
MNPGLTESKRAKLSVSSPEPINSTKASETWETIRAERVQRRSLVPVRNASTEDVVEIAPVELQDRNATEYQTREHRNARAKR